MRIVLVVGGVLGLSYTNIAQSTSPYQNSLNKLEELRVSNLQRDLWVECDSLLGILANEIFPAWYGTPWDFNGISNTPGKGEIACGYFVSTTLKHAGFNLNRYKLAQQASAIITKEVCGAKYTQNITGLSDLFTALKAYHNAMFIVGLDYHVGFIVVENGESFFVHSDFISDQVLREKAIESESLKSSTRFVLGQLSHNKELINKWKNSIKIY